MNDLLVVEHQDVIQKSQVIHLLELFAELIPTL